MVSYTIHVGQKDLHGFRDGCWWHYLSTFGGIGGLRGIIHNWNIEAERSSVVPFLFSMPRLHVGSIYEKMHAAFLKRERLTVIDQHSMLASK